MRTETPRVIHLRDYQAPGWLVDTVDLDFLLHAQATRARAKIRLRPNPSLPSPGAVELDGDGLTLVSLRVNGTEPPAGSFSASPDRLTLFQPPPAPFDLEIETLIDPSANTQLMGLYRSGSTYCTQCEAEGFRRITYFPDRPDVMAVYTTRIEASKAESPVLLSNGNLVTSGDISGTDRHFAVWHDPFPKPSYLFALVGGSLAFVEKPFVTASGRTVALRIYVEPGKEDRCGWAMDCLERAMRWDEDVFGREYDLDVFMIVAVSDFNMGAMENKGLNIFNDKYVLADSATAADADFANIEAIIAHEYFHNWTGNRITCRDWFQLCLKEGLTVFRDQEFSSDQRSRAVKRIADVRALRTHQFTEDAGPLAHPVRPTEYREINNFYTATVYEKGAEIVRMLKTLIGPGGFRKGMDLYFARHDGRAATVEEFVACFADASGRDLAQFMLWYAQSGTPTIALAGDYAAQAATYTLEVAQVLPPTPGQPHKDAMVIPLALGLVGPDGRDFVLVESRRGRLERNVVVLDEEAARFVFTGISARPVLSVNRGFSAPVTLNMNQPAADLAFLASHDSDPFNRWQALQSMTSALLVADVRALGAHGVAGDPAAVIEALAASLADPGLDAAFLAQVLALPGEADIARDLGTDVDPEAVHRARTALRRAIGSRLAAALRGVFGRLARPERYSPDAGGAGRRALKNACLDLLACTGDADALALAHTQFEHADNMTDRMAALTTIAFYDAQGRGRRLDEFYLRYRDDPLIIDKWFALQATLPDDGTLERVRSLTGHPAFSITTPNRVRALVGTFAQMNLVQFNRKDGRGYGFVGETVLRLDPINPQVAARLLASFKSWRALEPTRRAAARAVLETIDGRDGLSRDVADIVKRSLAESDATAQS